MLTLQSPAKINLFLKVINRRADGYHNLASLFQAVDLCDTIHMQLDEQDNLSCSNPSLPTNSDNLILKASQLFRKKTGLRAYVKVHLEKKIPYLAGLGGGSSNAATTLWGINELLGKPASLKDLIKWSGEIGSDVTFFLSDGTAYCTGRGEQIRPLNPLKKQSLWLAKPKIGLSTPDVFRRLNMTTLPQRDHELILKKFIENDSDPTDYFNDLETSAFLLSPQLSVLKEDLLNAGFSTVLMTGSGTCFFCFGKNTNNPPSIKDVTFYQVNFLNRAKDFWYKNNMI